MRLPTTRRSSLPWLILVLLSGALSPGGAAQGRKPAPTAGPMLDQGTMSIETADFQLDLVRSSQTVAALRAKGAEPFDFTPGDLLVERSRDGYYHLGDIDLRVRTGTSGEWKHYSSAVARTAVTALPASSPVLAAADLAPTLPAGIPLQITRSWRLDRSRLVLRFELKNRTDQIVQIGALGIPMIFNNVLSNRSSRPGARQLRVLRPVHRGRRRLPAGHEAQRPRPGAARGARRPDALRSLQPDPESPPCAGVPAGAAAPAPQIFTDPTPRGTTFEGFFDWMVHSQAYAENEWKQARPWNPPTLLTLRPGESRSYGVAFVLSQDLRRHRCDALGQRAARGRRCPRLRAADRHRRAAVPEVRQETSRQ